MRILLDTEAFIKLSEEGVESLGPKSRKVIVDPDHDLLISSVSITELAIKSNIGKLSITANLFVESANHLRLGFVPYESKHAIRLFGLPLHHRDPFDRMLVAVALAENFPLISSDRQFKKYAGLQLIW